MTVPWTEVLVVVQAVGNRRNRYRVGVLVPYTNTNLEPDLALMRPPSLSIHATRIAGYAAEGVPDLAEMQQMGGASISDAVNLFKPISLDVLLYGCTSATLALGWEGDHQFGRQLEAMAGCPAITTSGAVVEALRACQARKVHLVTPYAADLSRASAAFLSSAGFEVVSIDYPPEDVDSLGQGALAPERVVALAVSGHHQAADAIVITCTELRALECIDEIEELTGKPVITSNQALFWSALRVLGLPPDTIPGGLAQRPVP